MTMPNPAIDRAYPQRAWNPRGVLAMGDPQPPPEPFPSPMPPPIPPQPEQPDPTPMPPDPADPINPPDTM